MKKGICAILMLITALVLLTGCASIGAGKNDTAYNAAQENLAKAEAALANGEFDQAVSYANEAKKFYDKIDTSVDDPNKVYPLGESWYEKKKQLLARYNDFSKKFEIAEENKEFSDKLNSELATSASEADFKVELTKDGKGAVIIGYVGSRSRIGIRIPVTIQGMPVREIGKEAFRDNRNLVSIVIPEGVTKIGTMAFRENDKLQSVTLPEGLLEISESAFIKCPITVINFPGSLEFIGREAFANTKITSVSLPAGLIDPTDAIFSECTNLKTVTLPKGFRRISEKMFYNCTALTSVNLPDTITEIDKSAFRGCRSLTSVTLPSSLKNIGEDAFSGCGLTSITLPSTVEVIGAGAFGAFRGSSLTSVTLSSSIKVIGREAFKDCSSLTTVTIPETVGSIQFNNNNAFSGCSKLNLASQAALKRVGYKGSF